jgi:hypothetical protein
MTRTVAVSEPRHREVGMIRFSGHLSRGEYDVQTDGRYNAATSASPAAPSLESGCTYASEEDRTRNGLFARFGHLNREHTRRRLELGLNGYGIGSTQG